MVGGSAGGLNTRGGGSHERYRLAETGDVGQATGASGNSNVRDQTGQGTGRGSSLADDEGDESEESGVLEHHHFDSGLLVCDVWAM